MDLRPLFSSSTDLVSELTRPSFARRDVVVKALVGIFDTCLKARQMGIVAAGGEVS